MLVPAQINALIVDDNAYARAATAATLRKLGLVNIVETDNGPDALLTLLSDRYDVFFLDWYMPEMSGAALLQTIRDARFGPKGTVYTVLMTAYPSREVLTRARQLGISDVLTKPFAHQQVSVVLQRLLAGWSASPAAEVKRTAGGDQFFL